MDVRPDAGLEPRPRRRGRYFHGGAISMLMIATVLAVVTALIATFVWANVDSRRPLATPTTIPSEDQNQSSLPPVTQPGVTTTSVPERLSEDELGRKVSATVRPVKTLDEAGRPVQGTAFTVGTFSGQTGFLTSFNLVRASTRLPSPGITVGDRQATLWTWQENRDLALLVVGGSIESLAWASAPPAANDKVWVQGAGQRLTVGIVTGVSEAGIDHNVFIDDVRQGAPMVNQRGEILGMASKVYDPAGKATDTLFVAIPIRAACERMLRCGGGNTAPSESTSSGTTTTTARG